MNKYTKILIIVALIILLIWYFKNPQTEIKSHQEQSTATNEQYVLYAKNVSRLIITSQEKLFNTATQLVHNLHNNTFFAIDVVIEQTVLTEKEPTYLSARQVDFYEGGDTMLFNGDVAINQNNTTIQTDRGLYNTKTRVFTSTNTITVTDKSGVTISGSGTSDLLNNVFHLTQKVNSIFYLNQ